MATVLFHVSSRVNRESILRHGLDSQRMVAALNVAGSPLPERDGIFLGNRSEAEWFREMGNDRHVELDTWEVRLEEEFDRESPSSDLPCELIDGFLCWNEPIPPQRISLVGE